MWIISLAKHARIHDQVDVISIKAASSKKPWWSRNRHMGPISYPTINHMSYEEDIMQHRHKDTLLKCQLLNVYKLWCLVYTQTFNPKQTLALTEAGHLMYQSSSIIRVWQDIDPINSSIFMITALHNVTVDFKHLQSCALKVHPKQNQSNPLYYRRTSYTSSI